MGWRPATALLHVDGNPRCIAALNTGWGRSNVTDSPPPGRHAYNRLFAVIAPTVFVPLPDTMLFVCVTTNPPTLFRPIVFRVTAVRSM